MSSSGHTGGTGQGGGDYSAPAARACGACGARARRAGARFCATCGRALGGEYFPADSLRASYRFERPHVSAKADAPSESGRRRVPRPTFMGRKAGRGPTGGRAMPRGGESGAASLALAFVTYALVPYLGILFCPGALLFGGLGLVRAWRTPRPGHARASALGLALGLLVLCAQLLLWWILYKAPEWARGAPF